MPQVNVQQVVEAADDLASLVTSMVEQGGDFPSLEMLDDAMTSYYQAAHGTGQSAAMVTAIDAKLWRASFVLRRLVALTGFQAELVAYGGDFGEFGTNVERDCRISVRREEFDIEQIMALAEFANDHECFLTMGRHGATLRPKNRGVHHEIEQNDSVEANATATGAAAG